MVKNYRVVSLYTFYLDEEILDKLLLTKEFLLLILKRARSILPSRSCTRIQTAKIIARGIEKYQKHKVNKRLRLYKYGIYPSDYKKSIDELIKFGYVQKEKTNQLSITNTGLNFLNNNIQEIRDELQYKEMINFIDTYLFRKVTLLTKEVLDNFHFLTSKEKTVGSYSLELIFNWSEYGYGDVKPYHYILLFSYESMKDYFHELKEYKKFRKIVTPLTKQKINTSQLTPKLKKYSFNNTPLTMILQKQDPKWLSENKFEGKNYIYNLWYLIEAINIIQKIENISPSIIEIARLSLINYRHGENIEELTNETKWRTRSKYIRNDIKLLYEWGIIDKIKIGNYNRYYIKADQFYDDILERSFDVLDSNALLKLYNKRIIPHFTSMMNKYIYEKRGDNKI